MDDRNKRILDLIEKFEQGIADEVDMQELDLWFRAHETKPDITNGLTEQQQWQAKLNLFKRISRKIDLEGPEEGALSQSKITFTLWMKTIAAASVLILFSLGMYLFLNKGRQLKQGQDMAGNHVEDFAPGTSKAMLTLGDGRQIVLDGVQNGTLTSQGNTVIEKINNGKIVYGHKGQGRSFEINTLATPRGGVYRLTLADGTAVWLNASSSISYPSLFTGNTREVSISGEAYLEVAHDPNKPFRVKTGTQTVEVLGTRFNINAYQGQNLIKTTLLEGAVALTSAGQRKLLKPGEQALLNRETIQVEKVDMGEIMAWKDGFFDFTDADIQTVMWEFSRWYDLDIVFDGPQTEETFTGRIPRTWSFAKVMKIMETFKSTHIKAKGRRIMVSQQ